MEVWTILKHADLQVFSLKTYQTYQTSSEQPVRAKPKKDSPFRITMYSCPGSTEPAIWSASCRMLSEGIARTVPDSSSSAQCLIQDHYCMIKSRCIKWQCLVRPKKFLQNGQVNHDHVRNFKELLQKSMLAATPWCQPLNIQKRDNVVNPIINHPQWHQKWFGRPVGLVFTIKHWEFIGNYWIYHMMMIHFAHILLIIPNQGCCLSYPHIFCVLNPHLQFCFIWVVVDYPIIIHNIPPNSTIFLWYRHASLVFQPPVAFVTATASKRLSRMRFPEQSVDTMMTPGF